MSSDKNEPLSSVPDSEFVRAGVEVHWILPSYISRAFTENYRPPEEEKKVEGKKGVVSPSSDKEQEQRPGRPTTVVVWQHGEFNFYAVVRGRIIGIFDNLHDTEQVVSGFPGALFQKFPTYTAAVNWFDAQWNSMHTWPPSSPTFSNTDDDEPVKD
jgi:hypothetical protein